MAEYIIQGETLTDIADQIRSRTGSNNLISPTDMGSQVQLVYAKGYTNGKKAITDGEKRDETNVTDSVDVESRSVDIDIDSGYYANGVSITVDVQDVYDQGYDDGRAAGGGGGDEPYDPTTVWLLNDVLVNTGADVSGTTINVPFVSAGEEFVKIVHTTLVLNYYRSDGTIASAWSSRKGWTSDEYKTITFPEEITDETLQTWLDANATLISGGGGGESSEDLEALGALCEWMVSTDSESMATVTICNYHPSYFLHCNVWAEYSDVSFVNVIISPDSCGSVMFTDYTFSTINPIYVDNVRWTKRGTA